MIDFSQSYFADGQSVLTRADSPVQRLADLEQTVVAVSSGLESVNELTTLIMGAAMDGAIAPTVLPFQEIRSAQQALLLGQVDAVIGSSVALAQIQQTNPTLKIAVADFIRQAYAIGIPPFDAQLRDQVNFTLQALAADGAYATFYQQWFDAMPDPLALWFADSARVDPAAQSPQLTLRPAAWSIDAVSAASTVTTLRPTATPALLTSAHGLSLASMATNLPQPLLLQPTVTPLAPLANAAVTPAALFATSTTSAVLSSIPPSTTAQSLLPTTVTIRIGLNANARRAPTTTAPILAVLAGGTEWPVITVASDGQWIEVQLPDGVRAWVAASLLVIEDGLAALLATPTSVPPAPTAPPIPTSNLTHRVKATDTLAGIAKTYYGEQRHWRLIYEANRTAIGDDPNALPLGVELVIPPLPE
jgi:polar amino acid transport system substrate-binding protein